MSDPMMDAKIKKLPEWAQNWIAKLTSDRDAAQQALHAAMGPNAERTDTAICDDVPVFGALHGLPPGSTVRFRVMGHEVDARVHDGALRLQCTNGRLVVLPEVTNAITIEARR